MYDSKQDTMEHKKQVSAIMQIVIDNLTKRMNDHDNSKLSSPEKEKYDECIPLIKQTVFGTPEYKDAVSKLGDALGHHYRNNDHHPEYHGEHGVIAMDLLQLIEMICDWRASAKRDNRDWIESFHYCCDEKYHIQEPLKRVLFTTIMRYLK